MIDQADLREQGILGTSTCSATLCARVYDKTLDVERTGHEWSFEVWGDDFDLDSRVARVEFEFQREALGPVKIDPPAEAVVAAGGLWRHRTCDWLTYRTPTADSNRTRWHFRGFPTYPIATRAVDGWSGRHDRLQRRERYRMGWLRRSQIDVMLVESIFAVRKVVALYTRDRSTSQRRLWDGSHPECACPTAKGPSSLDNTCPRALRYLARLAAEMDVP